MEAALTTKFMLEPWEIKSLMSGTDFCSDDVASFLPCLVPSAQLLSRPPISLFPVGAAAVGLSGRVYLGCNLEFPGLPLHHSVHSEQFLLANASLHAEPHLLHLAVSAAPCGHCRQFFQELRNSSALQILVTSDQYPAYRPLSDFLPRPFGPPDLLRTDLPLLLEKHGNRIMNRTSKNQSPVVSAAVEAAGEAHCPYSNCPSGFAVVDGDGRIYKGSYMESAAYNPSLGPVQAAMVGYLVGGGQEWEKIAGGALAEGEGAKVSHEGTARIFFEKVAPKAELQVHNFTLG